VRAERRDAEIASQEDEARKSDVESRGSGEEQEMEVLLWMLRNQRMAGGSRGRRISCVYFFGSEKRWGTLRL
jgi:hypothetical protein